MGKEHLGEFEELVLLAVCGLPDEAYALAIQRRLEERARRTAALGSLYRTLNRLETKGYVRSWMGDVTPQPGGKRKRLYEVTGSGLEAVAAAQEAREQLRRGLDLSPSLRTTT